MTHRVGSKTMTSLETKREVAEANRRRYEELRAAGQEATPKALPSATALAPLRSLRTRDQPREIPADWYAIVRLRRGERCGSPIHPAAPACP